MSAVPFAPLPLLPLRDALAAAPFLHGDDPHWTGGWMTTHPAQTLPMAPPLSGSADDAERRFFAQGTSDPAQVRPYRIPERFLARLRHARVAGSFIVVSARGEVIQESFSGDGVLHEGGRFRRLQQTVDVGGQRVVVPYVLERRSASQRQTGAVILLAQHWHYNYHHWLIDCLPRLRTARDHGLLEQARLLIPSQAATYVRESLSLLGVSPAQCLLHDGGSLEVDTLWWPSQGCFAPDEVQWLRETCRAAAGSGAGQARRLYVSRADADRRRLVNEEELRPRLEAAGFEIVSLRGMPFADQVRLFAQASVIAGPHGAGLTNQVFAPPGTKLLELMPDTAPNLCFYLLSQHLQQGYDFAVGARINDRDDFTVTPARLARLLAAL